MTILRKPTFELGKYLELEIPKPDVNRDVVGLVEGSLQALRIRLGEHLPFNEDDVVALGDKVTMSSEATVDGKVFEDGTFEGLLYRIGDARYPEFDDHLIGMKADEQREFELVFPEEFWLNDFAGKTVKFKVTVHMGMKLVLHEVNTEFFEKCGVKDLDELKENMKKITLARIKDTENLAIKNQVSRQLITNHDFEIPQFLIDNEVQSIAAQYNIDVVRLSVLEDEIKTEFTKKAVESIRLTLVLDAIREIEPEAVMSDNEAIQVLSAKIQAQGQDANKTIAEAQKRGTLFGIIASLKNDFVLEWLASKVKIVE